MRSAASRSCPSAAPAPMPRSIQREDLSHGDPSASPMDMPKHFRFRVERTVSAARTVSLENRLYEVPLGYTRKRLELRYFSLDSVEAYYNGESIGRIAEVNLTANSRTFRGPRKEDER